MTIGTCLIVDDNYRMLDVCKKLLEIYAKINVYTALSGQQAIDMCMAGRFDFILMDIAMPEMDGIEAAKKIKLVQPEALIVGWTCEPEYIPKLDKEVFSLIIHKVMQKDAVNKLINDILEIASTK